MGDKIHTEAFDVEWNSNDFCGDTFNLNRTNDVQNVRTNCGNDKVSGAADYNWDASGPLEFGTTATEKYLWDAMAAGEQAWAAQPDGGSATGTANPEYSGSALASSLTISFSATGFANYSFNAEGTDSTGIPTRATS